MNNFSLRTLCLRFKWRISATVGMIGIGAGLELLFPLAIGFAIDGLIDGNSFAVWPLAALGLGALVVGTLQRFYDTRIYAGIYRTITPEMVAAEQSKGSDLSIISARVDLLTEFVEFLESTMPEIIQATVNLVGVLILIAFLDLNVFIACVALLSLMLCIFWVTGGRNYLLNARYNDELEKQVNVLGSRSMLHINQHLKRLMGSAIKISDLETINYFVLFLGVIALLVFTPLVVVDSGVLKYGMVFSILMYVLSYVESLVACPIFIQKLIRLHEIAQRISSNNSEQTNGTSG